MIRAAFGAARSNGSVASKPIRINRNMRCRAPRKPAC